MVVLSTSESAPRSEVCGEKCFLCFVFLLDSTPPFYFFWDSMVSWWLALFPHGKRVLGSNPGRGLSVWSLHVLSLLVWVFSRYSGFLQHSKDMMLAYLEILDFP